jgi:hypothetical protein
VGNARQGRQGYTPTGPFTVTTTYTGQWSRDNEDILIDLDIEFSAAPTGTNASFTHAQILNGLGLTVDTTKLPNVANTVIPCGTWSILDSGVTIYGGPAVVSNTTVDLYTAAGVLVTKTTPLTFGAADNLSMSIRLPITGWSSNVTMADRAVEEYAFNTSSITAAGASDTTSFGYGPNGTPFNAINSTSAFNTTSFRCQFTTPIQATDSLSFEYQDGVGRWVPLSTGWDATTMTNQADSIYGIQLLGVTGQPSQVDVSFGNKGRRPNTGAATAYGANGDTWSGLTSRRWRVRKVSGGAQVGYPISSANIVGRVDGNAPATGMVGQVVSFDTSSLTIQTSATTKNVATITNLPAGTWALFAGVELDPGTTLTVSNWEMSISGTSATTNPACGGTFGNPSASNYTSKGSVGPLIVNISAATTYYLTTVARWTGSGGTWANARFQAIRIA